MSAPTLSECKYCILLPFYEDTPSCKRLLRDIYTTMKGTIDSGNGVSILIVDDGSLTHTISVTDIHEAGLPGAVIRLRRNVGHQMALAIGLHYLHGRLRDDAIVVTMDSDGEDIPASIPELLQGLEADVNVDICVAQRRERFESTRFKLFYKAYKLLFSLMTGRSIDFGNFMAMKRTAVSRLVAINELSIHLAATTLLSKLRIRKQPIDRGERYFGVSKMNFQSLLLHGFKAFMVFAEDVLVRVGIGSGCIAVFSILCSVLTLLLKLAGNATPGWTTTVIGVMTMVFFQTGILTVLMLMLAGITKNSSKAVREECLALIAHVEE